MSDVATPHYILNGQRIERPGEVLPPLGPLPPGTCVRCGEPSGRIIPAWWLRDEDGTPNGGLCSDCCEMPEEPKKTRRRRR